MFQLAPLLRWRLFCIIISVDRDCNRTSTSNHCPHIIEQAALALLVGWRTVMSARWASGCLPARCTTDATTPGDSEETANDALMWLWPPALMHHNREGRIGRIKLRSHPQNEKGARGLRKRYRRRGPPRLHPRKTPRLLSRLAIQKIGDGSAAVASPITMKDPHHQGGTNRK